MVTASRWLPALPEEPAASLQVSNPSQTQLLKTASKRLQELRGINSPAAVAPVSPRASESGTDQKRLRLMQLQAQQEQLKRAISPVHDPRAASPGRDPRSAQELIAQLQDLKVKKSARFSIELTAPSTPAAAMASGASLGHLPSMSMERIIKLQQLASDPKRFKDLVDQGKASSVSVQPPSQNSFLLLPEDSPKFNPRRREPKIDPIVEVPAGECEASLSSKFYPDIRIHQLKACVHLSPSFPFLRTCCSTRPG
jgi:hypothetical protein